MGELGEYWRDVKEFWKHRKEENMKMNMNALNKSGISYEVHNQGYQININRIAFYPSTNKWVCKNKVYYGTANNFIDWLRKKEVI